MKVKNLHGTSGRNCKCESWLAHWVRFTRNTQGTIFCAVTDCFEFATNGAHVIKVGSTNQDWYIVPLCDKHNKSEEILDIGTVPLAPAAVNKTCKL